MLLRVLDGAPLCRECFGGSAREWAELPKYFPVELWALDQALTGLRKLRDTVAVDHGGNAAAMLAKEILEAIELKRGESDASQK